ncbi:FecR family protein [Pedobacter chinensis]|uniref:FecR family protein n=1 Tax=Pedobacter chinensis TaxID=2282421 RepID=A0A369PWD2_9SPHI|nr:FecR family protein [Pedobacter chinensis]RDC56540.1 FecR family protein [Pedobacter chinensis]
MEKYPFGEETISRFFEGTLSEAQHQQVLDWLSVQNSDVLEAFMDRQLEMLEMDQFKTDQSAVDFSFIEWRIMKRRNKVNKLRTWSIGIAATMLPLAFLFLFLGKERSNKNVADVVSTQKQPDGKFERRNSSPSIQDFYLPDSSAIRLYPGATLSYTSASLNAERKVYLSGKAFFDVRHMEKRPFTVHTGTLRTVVLGTSFWVDASNGYKRILVNVKSGKVGVIEQGKPAIFLSPKESALFQSTGGLVKLTPPVKVGTKVPGKIAQSSLAFNQTPLNTVISELSGAFGREIIYQQGDNAEDAMPVSLNTKGKSLNEILKEIKTQIPIDYEIKQDRIIITRQ